MICGRYEMFLDTCRSEMTVGGAGDGNLPVNVPASPPGRPMDISWTAAYPLVANWLCAPPPTPARLEACLPFAKDRTPWQGVLG